MAASIEMMAMTTSSSIKVKACPETWLRERGLDWAGMEIGIKLLLDNADYTCEIAASKTKPISACSDR
jgi:hypothetical protein